MEWGGGGVFDNTCFKTFKTFYVIGMFIYLKWMINFLLIQFNRTILKNLYFSQDGLVLTATKT